MDNSSNQSSQSRFIVAAVLSLVVLFAWSYFFNARRPATDANANVAANTAAEPTAAPQAAPTAQAAQPAPVQAATTPDNTPGRIITIKSPLYEVKLDSKGGVASSWIIKKN